MDEYSPSIGTISNGCSGEVAQERPPLARRRLVFSDNFEVVKDKNDDDSEKENRVSSKPKRNRYVPPSPFHKSPVSTSSPLSARVPAASTPQNIISQMKHQRYEEGFRWEDHLPWILRVGEQEYYFAEIQDIVDLTVFLYEIMKNSCEKSPKAVNVSKGDGNHHVLTPFDGLGHGAAVNENVSVIFRRNGNIVSSPPAIPYLEAGIGVSNFNVAQHPIVDPEPSGQHIHAHNNVFFEVYRSYNFTTLAFLGTYYLMGT